MNEEQQNSQTPPTPPEATSASPATGQQSANTSSAPASDLENHKHIAMAARVPFLFWIPFASDAKESPYVMFHANQGLLLLAVFIIGQMFVMVSFLYPLMWIVQLVVLVFTILGVLEASKGEKKPLPLIGHITLLK